MLSEVRVNQSIKLKSMNIINNNNNNNIIITIIITIK